jgi:hypothetical protein
LSLSGSSNVNKSMKKHFDTQAAKLKTILSNARKLTICLDGWSKKALTAAFLGISACFYDPASGHPLHAFLNLSLISHPHTGDMIQQCLSRSLTQWDIKQEQVLLIVCDNGANMLKAISLLQRTAARPIVRTTVTQDHELEDNNEQNSTEEDYNNSTDEHDEDDYDDDISDDEQHVDAIAALDLPPDVPFRHMSCMAHTLQLIVKPAYKHYEPVLNKTRHMIGKIRRSSVAMQKLVSKCGRTVINDCVTRWNSTHAMVKRLISIKSAVNEVLCEIGLYLQLILNVLKDEKCSVMQLSFSCFKTIFSIIYSDHLCKRCQPQLLASSLCY